MNPTNHPSSPSATTEAGALGAAVGWLRAELDATEPGQQRALLEYETGILEESRGDDTEAARLLLAAVTTEPRFREPLERLIALIERRQSFKNLGRLLERLAQSADDPEEHVRAAIARSLFALQQEGDATTALSRLLDAAERLPAEPAIWIVLALLAEQLDDPSLKARALAARVPLTDHVEWRGLLQIELAEFYADDQQFERAVELLESVVDLGGNATFRALESLERLASREQRHDVLARTLGVQASLAERARADEAEGDAAGVPRSVRSDVGLADICLRAAIARDRLGDEPGANAALLRALALCPNDPLALEVATQIALASGQLEEIARVAELTARSTEGTIAAADWLHVLEARLALGDREGGRDALRAGLAAHPNCLPLRVFELDWLAGRSDGPALAQALESHAETLGTDTARAGTLILAAEVWARAAGEGAAARAALAQATLLGAEPATVNRISRLLAANTRDHHWYEEATRRLIAAGAGDLEFQELGFELLRLRLERGEPQRIVQSLKSLRQLPSAGAVASFWQLLLAPWLNHTRGRDSDPPPSSLADPSSIASSELRIPTDEALLQLAELVPDIELSRNLKVVAACRQLEAGALETAAKELHALFAGAPEDPLLATVLSCLEPVTGESRGQSRLLRRAAECCTEPSLAAVFALQAAFAALELRDNDEFSANLELASGLASRSASRMRHWGRLFATPDEPELRAARCVELVARGEGTRATLESALRAVHEGQVDLARATLSQLDGDDPSPLGTAAWLLDALLAPEEEAASALAKLTERVPEAHGLRRSLEFAALSAASPTCSADERLESAARWAEVEPNLAAAIAWLAAAQDAAQLSEELSARAVVESLLPREVAAVLAADRLGLEALTSHPATHVTDLNSEALRIVQLELAPPGVDARLRANALHDARAALEPASRDLVDNLLGFNCLVAGHPEQAARQFRAALAQHPKDVAAWEGLALAAEQLDDPETEAQARAALGDLLLDRWEASLAWEQAASLLLDRCNDPARGEFALERAFARDPHNGRAFERLFRRLRERDDSQRLLERIEQRLPVTDDLNELVKLHWERARLLRKLGDREGALVALENVTLLEPEHVGALALSGEIFISTGQFERAAETLALLARTEYAPRQQRLMGATASADLYEGKLQRPEAALDVLSQLDAAGYGDLQLHERIARLAIHSQNWAIGAERLEQLQAERPTREGRVEAARLACDLCLSRLDDVERAMLSLNHWSLESAADPALVSRVSKLAPGPTRSTLLASARLELLQQLEAQSPSVELLERLLDVARASDNQSWLHASLAACAVLAPGAGGAELAALAQRAAHSPEVAIDSPRLELLLAAGDAGPIAALFAALAPVFAETLGPQLSQLGVGRKQRLLARDAAPLWQEVTTWAGAVGLAEFEVYVAPQSTVPVVGVATEPPSLVLGPEVTAPLSPAHRALLARELLALARGVTPVLHRTRAELAALVAATCRVAGVDFEGPRYALTEPFAKSLDRALPRKLRKLLPSLCAAIATSDVSPEDWAQAAAMTLARWAVVSTGDVSQLLLNPHRGQQERDESNQLSDADAALIRYCLSDTYLQLRFQLGLSAR